MLAVALEPRIAFAIAEWQALDDEERAVRIRAAMAAANNIKAAELARRLGITGQAVGNWLNAKATADWARWMAIAMALGLPLTWKPGDPVPPSVQ